MRQECSSLLRQSVSDSRREDSFTLWNDILKDLCDTKAETKTSRVERFSFEYLQGLKNVRSSDCCYWKCYSLINPLSRISSKLFSLQVHYLSSFNFSILISPFKIVFQTNHFVSVALRSIAIFTVAKLIISFLVVFSCHFSFALENEWEWKICSRRKVISMSF
jgi:hypothetical protein